MSLELTNYAESSQLTSHSSQLRGSSLNYAVSFASTLQYIKRTSLRRCHGIGFTDFLGFFVFLCFCKRKTEKGFGYTLLNQQMNHLLIIIYIIGTHTCFHKNAKMQNMSTKASLHDLCPLTKHLNFFYTPYRRMAWKKLRHGVAVKISSPRKKIWHSSPNPSIPIKFYKISKNNSIFILLYKIKL